MKYVTRVQTSDGQLHETLAGAKHHANQRYGLALTTIAHQLVAAYDYDYVLVGEIAAAITDAKGGT